MNRNLAPSMRQKKIDQSTRCGNVSAPVCQIDPIDADAAARPHWRPQPSVGRLTLLRSATRSTNGVVLNPRQPVFSASVVRSRHGGNCPHVGPRTRESAPACSVKPAVMSGSGRYAGTATKRAIALQSICSPAKSVLGRPRIPVAAAGTVSRPRSTSSRLSATYESSVRTPRISERSLNLAGRAPSTAANMAPAKHRISSC